MVNKLVNLLYREVRGLHEAAYLLGLFALFSQLLALVRDRLLAHYFGAGEILDVYYAAFRIPDFVFVSVASLVSVYVLIPFLTERMSRSKEEVRAFVNAVFSFFFLFIIAVAAVAFLFTPALVKVFFPGIADASLHGELVLLTRILLLQPILLGVSNLFASVTQTYQRFVLYAISPLLYNIGIIAGIIFLYPLVGIQGLGWGVVLGAFLHMAVQVPFIVREGFLPRITFKEKWQTIKDVMILSLPRTAALSAHQIVLLFLVAFASLLVPGSISVLNFSFNLQSVPLVIIGVSYSVAAFPTLARFFSNGQREEFFDHVTIALRHIIFWSFPTIVLVIVLRAQIVRVILGSGAFDWADTRLTAAALALFIISLAAQAAVLLLVRGYYAAGNTRKPLLVNLLSSVLIIAFAYGLLRLFHASSGWQLFVESLLRVEGIPGTAVLMLPLGYSLGLLINVFILIVLFQRDFKKLPSALSRVFWQSLTASILGGIAAYVLLNVLDDVFDLNTFIGIFMQGFLAGAAGIVVLILVLKFLKSKELEEAFESLHRRFWRTRAIIPEQET